MRYLSLAVLLAASCIASVAGARSLADIRERGTIGLCVHPNSLPYASKADSPPGFQVELGRALARELGVSLQLDWILTQIQIFRTDCDIMLDVIADPQAEADSGLQISKPYYRSGVSLVVPQGSAVTSFATLNGRTKVGTLVGSIAAMTLDKRHVPISIYGFEEDILQALSEHEIDAGAVTATAASYFNKTHPAARLVILPPDESQRDLVWNVSVGVRRPDERLRMAIDSALDHLIENGTIGTIYARYGISLQQPQ